MGITFPPFTKARLQGSGAGSTNISCVQCISYYNFLRNSSGVGAYTGTAGGTGQTGGQLPNYWSVSGLGNLELNVIGTGATGGVPYIDLQITGTSSTGATQITFDNVNVSSSTSYALSGTLTLTAGSTANLSYGSWGWNALNSGGSQVSQTLTGFSPTGTPAAALATATVDSTVTNTVCYYSLVWTANAAVNMTIRFLGVQMQQGSVALTFQSTPVSAQPGISLYNILDTMISPVSGLTLNGFSSRQTGSSSQSGVQDLSIFTSGSVGLKLWNCVNMTAQGLSIFNFDHGVDFDLVSGGTFCVTFRDCLLSNCNKAVNVGGGATQFGEHIEWEGCNISNNNFGAWIICSASIQPQGASSTGGDFYFTECKFDYNNQWMIYYIGGSLNGDCLSRVQVTDTHFETGSNESGTGPRIFNDGNLSIVGCYCFESGSYPTALIQSTPYWSKTSVSHTMAPGYDYPNSINATPLVYVNSSTGENVYGIGNYSRVTGQSVLLRTNAGDVSDLGYGVDPSSIFIGSATTLTYAHQRAPFRILVGASTTITIPASSVANFIIGTTIDFIAAPGVTGTFAAAGGVTLTSVGSGNTFGAGKLVSLLKTGTNTWYATGQMT